MPRDGAITFSDLIGKLDDGLHRRKNGISDPVWIEAMPVSGKKQRFCDQCGQPLSDIEFSHEQNLITTADEKIIATTRDFLGVCPTHGRIYAKAPGHHSSITKKRLRGEFWKHKDILESGLPKEEYDFLYDAMHGLASPNKEQVARWRELIKPKPKAR